MLNLTEMSSIDWEEHDKRVAEYEESERKKAIEKRIIQSVPQELRSMTFESFRQNKPKQQEFYKRMKDASETIKAGGFVTVCLLGGYGIGKTHLSIALMIDLLSSTKTEIYTFTSKGKVITEKYDKPFTAVYILADEIRQKYEAARSYTEKQNQEDVISDYSHCDLLVMDEIGRTASVNLEKELIYKIINKRDENQLSTVLISNMNFTEFASHVGGATMDRLKDSAIFPPLQGMESQRGRS